MLTRQAKGLGFRGGGRGRAGALRLRCKPAMLGHRLAVHSLLLCIACCSQSCFDRLCCAHRRPRPIRGRAARQQRVAMTITTIARASPPCSGALAGGDGPQPSSRSSTTQITLVTLAFGHPTCASTFQISAARLPRLLWTAPACHRSTSFTLSLLHPLHPPRTSLSMRWLVCSVSGGNVDRQSLNCVAFILHIHLIPIPNTASVSDAQRGCPARWTAGR